MEKQEVEQILEVLKTMIEKMRAETEAIQAETEATRARTRAMRDKRMKANRDACIEDIKDTQEETMACQQTMEARLEEEEPASVDMTPEVSHEQKVPMEDAVVMPVREPRKRRQDRRYLAAVRRQKKEE
jgi:hypothetical protein